MLRRLVCAAAHDASALVLAVRVRSSSSNNSTGNADSSGDEALLQGTAPTPYTAGTTTDMPTTTTTPSQRVVSGRQGHYNSAYHLRRAKAADRRRRAGVATLEDDEQRSAHDSALLPMVRPGAQGLPPLEDSSMSNRQKSKFSFMAAASGKKERDYYSQGTVPNNTAKPLLPMWASSLTSPALGKQRLVEENWISMDSMGTVGEVDVNGFLEWLLVTSGSAAVSADGPAEGEEAQATPAPTPLLAQQLRDNVELHLRKSFQRGVYAKRDIKAGEVILTIPLAGTMMTAADGDANTTENTTMATEEEERGQCAWGTALNAETLRRHSVAVRDRSVLPFNVVKDITHRTRSSDFDPTPHSLFIDQLHFALMLACERAAGDESPLAPYLRLFGDQSLDDEHIRELHLGVLDPHTHMEYNDHRYRFMHILRELHKGWWARHETERAVEAARLRRERRIAAASAVANSSGDGASSAIGSEPSCDAFTPILKAPVNFQQIDPLTLTNTQSDGAPAHDGTAPTPTLIDLGPAFNESDPSEEESSTSRLKPPPSIDDIEWAFRLVLSRQRVLPHLRHLTADLAKESTREGYQDENEKLDPFAKAIVAGKWAFYRHVLRAVDEDRLRVNEYDPGSIATLVPLLDMFNHPSNGQANAAFSIVDMPTATVGGTTAGEEEEDDAINSGAGRMQLVPHLVVAATEDLEALDELTLLFSKCYSVSYSLYRFGFLPLRGREDDMVDLLNVNGIDGEMRAVRASGRPPAVGIAATVRAMLGAGGKSGDEPRRLDAGKDGA